MINEPAVDVLIRKLGAEENPVSRYALCVVASKRARQIIEAERNRGIHDFTGRDEFFGKRSLRRPKISPAYSFLGKPLTGLERNRRKDAGKFRARKGMRAEDFRRTKTGVEDL